MRPLRHRNEAARDALNSALHRLRGEILIATRKTKEGMHELRRALEIAKTQQAKSEEQRTAQTIAKFSPSWRSRVIGIFRPIAALRSLSGS